MRAILLTVTMTALVGTAQVAHADDSLENLVGPREMAVGEAMRGGATGASAIGMNPAGLGLNRELVFEGGYGYRGTDSASIFGVSACDSTAPMPGCFFYSYAGESPELGGMTMSRTTHVGGLAMSRPITPRVLLGSSAKYFHFESQMPGEKSASGVTFDLGMTLRMTDLINLGVTGYNLWGADSSQFPRAVGGGLLARPIPNLTMSFDSRWRLQGADERARYGGGLEYFVRGGENGYPLRAGVMHDNNAKATYVSGGIGMATLRWGIDLAARRAVSSTHETILMASMRFYGPREPAPALDSSF